MKVKLSATDKAEDRAITNEFIASCRRAIAKGGLLSAELNGKLIFHDGGRGNIYWDAQTFIKCSLFVDTKNDPA